MSALQLVGGLVALLVGAELLVAGGAGLARWIGISPMVIGLTVVSLGTSAPELAVGIDAARGGSPELAVGNIVGTNLVNILLILGLSALIVPIAFRRTTLRVDLPAMVAAALLFFLLTLDGTLSRIDGLVLLIGAVAYTWLLFATRRTAKGGTADPDTAANADAKGADATGARQREGRRHPWLDIAMLIGGLAIIVVGAELLVDGAVSIAHSLGVSEAVIGLTIIAVGTSAPELVTSMMATRRGDRDIAIGNLLGSSIYNIAIVLGITVLVTPGGIPVAGEVLATDLTLMVLAALLAVPVFLTGARINRAEGAMLIAAYGGYLAWLLATRT